MDLIMKLVIWFLSISSSSAGVVRTSEHKNQDDVGGMMAFFRDFKNLFGNNWWGTDVQDETKTSNLAKSVINERKWNNEDEGNVMEFNYEEHHSINPRYKGRGFRYGSGEQLPNSFDNNRWGTDVQDKKKAFKSANFGIKDQNWQRHDDLKLRSSNDVDYQRLGTRNRGQALKYHGSDIRLSKERKYFRPNPTVYNGELHNLNQKRRRPHLFHSGRRFSNNPTLDEFMGDDSYDSPFVFLDSSMDIFMSPDGSMRSLERSSKEEKGIPVGARSYNDKDTSNEVDLHAMLEEKFLADIDKKRLKSGIYNEKSISESDNDNDEDMSNEVDLHAMLEGKFLAGTDKKRLKSEIYNEKYISESDGEKSGIVLEKDTVSSANDSEVDLLHMARTSENQEESELKLKEIATKLENGERNTDGVILGHDALDFMSISSADSFVEFTEDLETLFSDDEERLHDEGKMVEELIGEEDNSVLCRTLDGLLGTCVTDKYCSRIMDANSEECGVLSATNKLYCCVHSATCDQQSSELVTYMFNERYPDVSLKEDGCPISINLLPGICQVRIDILHLSFTPRHSESCDPSNAVQVIGSPGGNIAKQVICGNTSSHDHLNTHNPHLYAHFNLSVDPSPLQSHFIGFFIAHEVPVAWNIRVSQIRCDLGQSSVVPLMSRDKCSQWYTHSTGTIESGEILVEGTEEFRSCIKPDAEACGVKYHVYNAVCVMPEQIRLLGSYVSLCNVSSQEWEIVVPMTKEIGVLKMISEQGTNARFKIGYSFIYKCTDVFQDH